MAAQPKKRTSHSRKNQRRRHDLLKTGALILCSHCRRPHIAHHACPNCGYYKGREVVPEQTARAAQ